MGAARSEREEGRGGYLVQVDGLIDEDDSDVPVSALRLRPKANKTTVGRITRRGRGRKQNKEKSNPKNDNRDV